MIHAGLHRAFQSHSQGAFAYDEKFMQPNYPISQVSVLSPHVF